MSMLKGETNQEQIQSILNMLSSLQSDFREGGWIAEVTITAITAEYEKKHEPLPRMIRQMMLGTCEQYAYHLEIIKEWLEGYGRVEKDG